MRSTLSDSSLSLIETTTTTETRDYCAAWVTSTRRTTLDLDARRVTRDEKCTLSARVALTTVAYICDSRFTIRVDAPSRASSRLHSVLHD